MELSLVLGILKEGLVLWNSKESTKYLDKVIRLEREYYEEFNKGSDMRSDFKLDGILLDLEIISRNFVKASKSGSGNSTAT